jgi:hypothetical protein
MKKNKHNFYRKSHFSTLIVGQSGDQTRANSVRSTQRGAKRSAIHYDFYPTLCIMLPFLFLSSWFFL